MTLDRKDRAQFAHPQTIVAMERIVSAVAAEFDIPVTHIYERDSRRVVSEARQLCCWLAHHCDAPLSYSQIGAALRRDHSTAFHSVAATQERIDTDMAFRLHVDAIERALRVGEDLVLAGRMPVSRFDMSGALEVTSR